MGFVEVGLGDASVPTAGTVITTGAMTGCCGTAAGMLLQPRVLSFLLPSCAPDL